MDWMKASQELAKVMKENETHLDKLARECPADVKLAVTRWALNHVADHSREGGSYRHLIYGRLGFGPEAYGPLLDGGMFISNNFDVEQIEQIKKIAKENGFEALKPVLNICDEPGCWTDAGCGWPDGEKYRWTCGKHYKP